MCKKKQKKKVDKKRNTKKNKKKNIMYLFKSNLLVKSGIMTITKYSTYYTFYTI